LDSASLDLLQDLLIAFELITRRSRVRIPPPL
jgi:hypothetical protein